MTAGVTMVILSGGVGKRFWPLTSDKTLFPFAGSPLISRCIGKTLPPGVDRIVVVSNPTSRQLYQQSGLFPIPHKVVVQEKPGGMGNALLSLKNELADRPVLVVLGDHYIDPPAFTTLMERAETSDWFGWITAWKPTGYFPGGYAVTTGNRLEKIVEKPGEGNEPGPYVVASGHFFRSAGVLLSAIRACDERSDDRYERAVSALAQKQAIGIVPYTGISLSLKYPWDVLPLMEVFLSQLKPATGSNVMIKNNVVIEGAVCIGNNVRIFENTKIVGPVWIGDNTVIGNGNIIRDSMIGEGVVSGFATDIARSFVGNEVWFHSNYIGDSVLDCGVSLGSGAVTANLRLDENPVGSGDPGSRLSTGRIKFGAAIGAGVRIGVNTSIMPGVKIGRNSLVGAGTIIARDVPEGSFVTTVQEQVVRKNVRGPASGSRAQFLTKI